MAPSEIWKKGGGPAVTNLDKDTLIVAAYFCSKNKFIGSIDYDKMASMTSFKNAATARTRLRQIMKKMNIDDSDGSNSKSTPTPSNTPKKRKLDDGDVKDVSPIKARQKAKAGLAKIGKRPVDSDEEELDGNKVVQSIEDDGDDDDDVVEILKPKLEKGVKREEVVDWV